MMSKVSHSNILDSGQCQRLVSLEFPVHEQCQKLIIHILFALEFCQELVKLGISAHGQYTVLVVVALAVLGNWPL